MIAMLASLAGTSEAEKRGHSRLAPKVNTLILTDLKRNEWGKADKLIIMIENEKELGLMKKGSSFC